MQFGSLRWASLLFVGVFLLFSHPATSAEKPSKIRFGTLPVLQALPLYVAQDKGFYGREGLDVELIPFNTAAEKDIALAAGSIDGYFGDLLTPIVLRGNGRDVFIVVTNYDTTLRPKNVRCSRQTRKFIQSDRRSGIRSRRHIVEHGYRLCD